MKRIALSVVLLLVLWTPADSQFIIKGCQTFSWTCLDVYDVCPITGEFGFSITEYGFKICPNTPPGLPVPITETSVG